MTQQVFISYSNENESDRRVADKIYDTLKAREISCWAAHRDIAAGQDWLDEIGKAISNSRVMIVVLSNLTEKSRYVRREVTQAADENITIIPFCIERVSLSGGLKLLLSDCQWINAYAGLQDKDLDGYWIGKYEVTFAQYDRYCEATGKEKPGDEGWGREKRPVINVSWDDATAYCQWVSQENGLTFQLPTEAQWEKAAHGSRGFRYPWGNDFDKNKCNSSESGLHKTMPVGSYPSGKSPYGCMDMAGNVWEWCADWYDKDYYKNSPSKNPPGPARGSDRVLRGGCWFDVDWFCWAACRLSRHPALRGDLVGFRLMGLL